MGRPSKYTTDLANGICEDLMSGISMKKACFNAGINFSTFCDWQDNNVEFSRLSTRALEQGTHNMASDCLEIADSDELDPQDKRIRIDTRLRLIGKWNRKIYGDKVTQEQTGPNGGPIQHEDVTESPVSKLKDFMSGQSKRK